jgi:tetratricopeptide (TPR) repeat protein
MLLMRRWSSLFLPPPSPLRPLPASFCCGRSSFLQPVKQRSFFFFSEANNKPNLAEAFRKALELEEQKKWDLARQEYEAIYKADATATAALYKIGDCYLREGLLIAFFTEKSSLLTHNHPFLGDAVSAIEIYSKFYEKLSEIFDPDAKAGGETDFILFFLI